MSARDSLERRLRGQRISHAELVKESQQQLQECGHGNIFQAKFIRLLAEAVVSGDSPILFQQRPSIRDPPTNHWQDAYRLVWRYLQEHSLDLTREAALTEFPQFPTIEPLVSGQQSSAHFRAVVQKSDSEPPAFPPKPSGADSLSGSDESAGVGSPLPQGRRGEQLAAITRSSAAEQKPQKVRNASGARKTRIEVAPRGLDRDDSFASAESGGSDIPDQE
jgi:hypothetical protein